MENESQFEKKTYTFELTLKRSQRYYLVPNTLLGTRLEPLKIILFPSNHTYQRTTPLTNSNMSSRGIGASKIHKSAIVVQ